MLRKLSLIIFVIIYLSFHRRSGLSQNYQATNGFGHNKKTVGKYVLLEWQRMYPGFQYDVYQLLRLQQTRRRCCSYGTSTRKIVSYEGNNRS